MPTLVNGQLSGGVDHGFEAGQEGGPRWGGQHQAVVAGVDQVGADPASQGQVGGID
jgi:hypothetical protein